MRRLKASEIKELKELPINQRIRRLRKFHYMTQKEFAEKVGVTQFSVVRWETAANTPIRQSLKQIRSAFKLPMDFFDDVRDLKG